MTKKFTEEQYQKIVETVNKYPDFCRVYYVQNGWVESKPTNTFNELIKALSYTVSGESEVNRMLALANPLTRELAHKQFVEKEKKYYWKLNGLYLRKDYSDNSIIFDSHMYKHSLTESEIREWGYNPEMFDKKELD